MLIETGTLDAGSLAGQTAIVTGAGRGIGFETARALIWLGCQVVIAEIDRGSGRAAQESLRDEFGPDSAIFVRTDVGSACAVRWLRRCVLRWASQVDIVVNNATITPMGTVKDVPVKDWDASYKVNLRGPVLLARAFLPEMIRRDRGVFVCVSSVGEAFMAAYESFKAAQVHLASTLDAELEGTGVHAFAIGPGLVRTPGAEAGIRQLAPLYGKTVAEFYAISREHTISVEAAGSGLAAAVALGHRFRGQETSAKQALIAAGIDVLEASPAGRTLTAEENAQALDLCRNIRQTLRQQSEGWQERSLFERQWMIRDFRKNAGMTVEQWLDALSDLEAALAAGIVPTDQVPLTQLADYYQHMGDLARGYEKDPDKLVDHLQVIQSWHDEIDKLMALLAA